MILSDLWFSVCLSSHRHLKENPMKELSCGSVIVTFENLKKFFIIFLSIYFWDFNLFIIMAHICLQRNNSTRTGYIYELWICLIFYIYKESIYSIYFRLKTIDTNTRDFTKTIEYITKKDAFLLA